MEKTIEIQKKSKPVVFLAILVLGVGASGLWVLLRFIFPMLQGFLDLKISAILGISVLTIWAIYLIIRQSSKTGTTALNRGRLKKAGTLAKFGYERPKTNEPAKSILPQ